MGDSSVSRGSRWGRPAALVLTAAGGALLALPAAPAITVSGLVLCLALLVAGARETSFAPVMGWTSLCVGVFVGGALWRGGVGWVVLGLTPAVLVLIAGQAWAMTQRLEKALAMSEVARAKLQRGNRILEASMVEASEAHSTLRTIVDSLEDGLLAATSSGEIELANAALGRVLEVETVSPGTRVDRAVPAVAALVRQSVDQRKTVATEIVTATGRVVAAVASPILHTGTLDAPWGTAVLVRDITLQKEIDRMKSDFAATVSHEMRTPLTSVLGFARMIDSQLERRILPALPAEAEAARRASQRVRDNLAIIRTEGRRLTALINDVLDLSRMESGQMNWSTAPHDAAALIDQAVAATSALLEDRAGLVLRTEVAVGLPEIEVDANRVVQVLVNLIGNAIKFTERGEIVVGADRHPSGVVFAVRDTGVGIERGHLEAIFEKFKQVGDILTDRPQGTGLGLPICREIVSHHGGEIHVESERGAGSRFWFTLPAVVPPASGTIDEEDGQ